MITRGKDIKVFTGNSNPQLAKDICRELGIPLGTAEVGTFSDGENFASIYETVRGSDVFVVQSTCAFEKDGKFYLIVHANRNLGFAVADSPLGPFVQKEKKWLNDCNEIDGHFFVDDDGTVYLYFVRFDDGNVLWCAKMNDDMLSYDKSTATFLFRAEDEWELRDCSVVEGAFVLKHNGKYYLTYSANHTRCEDYAVGCAVSDRPMGPFTKVSYNPILKKSDALNGTGHHSFTTSKDGRELVCVYHARPGRDTACARMTCVDRAEFVPDPAGGDDILVIHGPTAEPMKAFGE